MLVKSLDVFSSKSRIRVNETSIRDNMSFIINNSIETNHERDFQMICKVRHSIAI